MVNSPLVRSKLGIVGGLLSRCAAHPSTIARAVAARPALRLPGDRPLVLGHRGASADRPENTLEAFAEALRQGADGVELDVQLCASGEVVVAHDESLERVSGERVRIADSSLARLRRVDVGRRFAERFAGARVPTLEEVLEALPPEALLDVELKCDRARDGGLTRRTLEILARYPGRPVVVTSFNPGLLARARWGAPALPLGALWKQPGATRARALLARAAGVGLLAPSHRLCTPARVARWHRQGFAVAAWTVDAPADLARCLAAGVDVLIGNRPRRILEAVREAAAAG